MNTINVIVELGPESMAKLDKILEALQGQHHHCAGCGDTADNTVKDLAEAAAAAAGIPESEPEETEPPADAVSPAEQPEPAAAPEPEAPKYTKADVLALVQKLAAPTSPEAKRTGAKAIVKEYGAKVSDIPEAKYGEVMDKLTALDKEG
jgi:hypothetical protein